MSVVSTRKWWRTPQKLGKHFHKKWQICDKAKPAIFYFILIESLIAFKAKVAVEPSIVLLKALLGEYSRTLWFSCTFGDTYYGNYYSMI